MLGFDFNESEFDQFKVEKPDMIVVKSQSVILKHRETKELPKLSEMKGHRSNPSNELIIDGYGYYQFSPTVSYEGEWKGGKRHGKGHLRNSECGWDYVGYFEDNFIHGLGKYVWASGDVYVGYFLQNEKNGFGIYKWMNGSSYKGFWKNNRKHGLGEYTYPDKSYYYGNYNHDKPDGLEVYVWPDVLSGGVEKRGS